MCLRLDLGDQVCKDRKISRANWDCSTSPCTFKLRHEGVGNLHLLHLDSTSALLPALRCKQPLRRGRAAPSCVCLPFFLILSAFLFRFSFRFVSFRFSFRSPPPSATARSLGCPRDRFGLASRLLASRPTVPIRTGLRELRGESELIVDISLNGDEAATGPTRTKNRVPSLGFGGTSLPSALPLPPPTLSQFSQRPDQQAR